MKKRLPRLYAPFFRKSKDEKWQRATWKDGTNKGGFVKSDAVRIYQHWLLAPFLEGIDEIRELRPLPVKSTEYNGHPETWDK